MTLLLSLAMVLTYSIPLGVGVYAASAPKLNLDKDSVQTADGYVLVYFDQDITVADGAAENITNAWGDAIAESVTTDGSTLRIKLKDASSSISSVKIKGGTIIGADGTVQNNDLDTYPKADIQMQSVSFDKTQLTSDGGKVTMTINGSMLDQLYNYTFRLSSASGNVTGTQESATSSKLTVTFDLPKNETSQAVSYTLKYRKSLYGNYSTIDNVSGADTAITVAAAGGSTDPDTPDTPEVKTFTLEVDDFKAVRYDNADGSARVDVTFSKYNSMEFNPDIKDVKDYIYFGNGYDDSNDYKLGDEDKVEMNGNVLSVTVKDKSNISYAINLKKGLLKNPAGEILGANVKRYLTTGAHVESISYNQKVYTSEGGRLVATVKGSNLDSSDPALSANVYLSGEKSVSKNVKADVDVDYFGDSATITVDLPKNTTDKTISYRILPVVDGRTVYKTYLDGYDIVSVLPEGQTDDGTARLSSVELIGTSDENDEPNIFESTMKSADYTVKIDAVLTGTNLSSKKTKVKVVDENGVEWPVTPVYECGATIRWQNSAAFLPEDKSSNEQTIELLPPRHLGIDHTFSLYFAVDGEHFNDTPDATVIVHNNGVWSPENGFTLEELTQLKDVNIKYVDESGKEIADTVTKKAYGVTELYALGAAAKDIPGYTLKSCNVKDSWFDGPTEREDGSYEFKNGQHFVKDLDGDIVYTYSKDSKQTEPAVSLSTKTYTYNGKVRKPAVTVTVNGEKVSADNYMVSYASGRRNVGKYKVTVTMKGQYEGTASASFKIVPKKTSLKKVKPAKKSLTAYWSKQKTQTSGYQLQYSTSKKFTSKSTKAKTYKSSRITKAKLTKLKAKKTYYVRVRTYKTVKGSKYYSGWSKVKKARTK